jgi:amino acid permease
VVIPSASLSYVTWSGVSTDQIGEFVRGWLNPLKNVGTAIFFGCIGSVVSLLLRMSEFENTKNRSKAFLLLYGLTLPIVGGIFAAVLSALLDLGTIKIADNSTQTYIIVGFLSGFSERFTRNILNFAEDRIYPRAGDIMNIEDRVKAFEKRSL